MNVTNGSGDEDKDLWCSKHARPKVSVPIAVASKPVTGGFTAVQMLHAFEASGFEETVFEWNTILV